ncbi:MAG: SemiSWEET transporter [Burkholderiales bacterium]
MGLDWIGAIAGFLTTAAFVPQVVKIWTTKSADDISMLMFGIFTLGVLMWLIYGFMLGALPIILANVITLVLAVTVLVLKVRYRRRPAP